MEHHAYCYEGPLSLLTELVRDARERFGFMGGPPAGGNPDVYVREFEKFGVEESRALIQTAGLRSSSGRALFVLGISSITIEAQQALLKLLEEPQAGSIFVLLVPHGALLPTVHSRMVEYPKGSDQRVRQNSLARDSSDGLREIRGLFGGHAVTPFLQQQVSVFLNASGKTRSDIITKLLKDDEGVKERVCDFVNALEAALAKKMDTPKVREGLQDIAKVRSYLGDRSPSLKMLLEHLAATLPTV